MELTTSLIEQSLSESIKEAFDVTLSLAPEETSESPVSDEEDSVVSILSFSGDVEGRFIIYLSKESACQIISKMLFMEINEVTADVTDGMGEVINIIGGGVKNRLSSVLKNFSISIPTSLISKHFEILKDKNELGRVEKKYVCENIKFSVVFLYREQTSKVETEKTNTKQDGSAKLSELISKKPKHKFFKNF